MTDEYILEKGYKQYAPIQFDNEHIDEIVLFPLNDLGTLVKNQLTIDIQVYFWIDKSKGV